MTPGEIFAQESKPDGVGINEWIKGLAEKYGASYNTLKPSYYRFHKHKALAKEAEQVGIPIENVGHYWHKGKHFSIFSKTEKDPT